MEQKAGPSGAWAYIFTQSSWTASAYYRWSIRRPLSATGNWKRCVRNYTGHAFTVSTVVHPIVCITYRTTMDVHLTYSWQGLIAVLTFRLPLPKSLMFDRNIKNCSIFDEKIATCCIHVSIVLRTQKAIDSFTKPSHPVSLYTTTPWLRRMISVQCPSTKNIIFLGQTSFSRSVFYSESHCSFLFNFFFLFFSI